MKINHKVHKGFTKGHKACQYEKNCLWGEKPLYTSAPCETFVYLVLKFYRFLLLSAIPITENEISKIVFKCALKVHQTLGPGLLESAYAECLFYEVSKTGLQIEKQRPLPLIYEEVKLDVGYRLDIIIENKFIIEVKSVEALNDIHMAQILTYLRLANCKLGFIINFNVLLIKNGIKRVINGEL